MPSLEERIAMLEEHMKDMLELYWDIKNSIDHEDMLSNIRCSQIIKQRRKDALAQ